MVDCGASLGHFLGGRSGYDFIPGMFTLAMAQMRVVCGDRLGNLRRAVDQIATAAAQGAAVVVLPEAMDLGWTHPSAPAEAEPVPDGASCRVLREAARRHSIWVCVGLVERAGPEVFNAAVLIDDRGSVVLHHRKLNELDLAHDCYAGGDRLGVVETPFGRLGVMICADAFAPGQPVARTLGLMGARMILSPCAWAVPADHDPVRDPYGQLWRDHYGRVARDFELWIAGVSNVGALSAGPWAGRRCIGCSLLMDPSGTPVVQGPYGVDAEALLIARVAPRPWNRRGLGP